MNVTADVIRDLMPLVVTDEASPDTRVLVDAYVREHADLRGELERLRTALERTSRIAPPARSDELATLAATKSLLRKRGYLLGAAIFFTALPCSFVFADGRIQWFMLRDAAPAALASLAAGIGFWVTFFRVQSKLSPYGF
jgi:hypothetical protein